MCQDFAVGQKIRIFVNPANPVQTIIMEQYLRQPCNTMETFGYVLFIIDEILALIGEAIEAHHTIIQVKARSWDA